MKTLLYGMALSLLKENGSVVAIPATPFIYRQMNEGNSIDLQIHGDEFHHFVTDTLGYIVTIDEERRSVYGVVDENTGEIIHTKNIVGTLDPRNIPELQKGLLIDRSLIMEKQLHVRRSSKKFAKDDKITQTTHSYNDNRRRRLQFRRNMPNGTLQHLVVLIKFRDHETRKLPTRQMYDVFFNQVGGNTTFAPTGSVRDLFLANSYGKLAINSTVLDWIQLPETESYYAEKQSGLGNKLLDAMRTALDLIEDTRKVHFSDFDVNNDGFFDAVTFIHSGFGAEWGEEDCDGNPKENRIWSHHRNLSRRKRWCGRGHVCMRGYQIASGLWGRCTGHIAHIGVISHEIGHLLGLEDMYDVGGGGFGIGSYGLMGNCWGFDGSQLHPPLMDPWSKKQLGWITPTIISTSGEYYIDAVHNTGQVYQIDQGFPRGEYLLIENRQPNVMESLPQGGLAIWHIDERASFEEEGFPGQPGWPENGKHYKVSLLQADGAYHLERGEGYGDGSEVWHAGIQNELGPSNNNSNNNNNTKPGPYPNTDSYQGGRVKQTGIIIRDISRSGKTMSFTVILPNNVPSQSDRFLSWLVECFRRWY